jgi:hypothetical protein
LRLRFARIYFYFVRVGGGMVPCTAYPKAPARAEYQLMADGHRLKDVVHSVTRFGLWLKEERC